ncbi:ORF3 [Anelloviridae sp.]|nr:ORF3 [Anelloviridae sp.]
MIQTSIPPAVRTLEEYRYVTQHGQDWGSSIPGTSEGACLLKEHSKGSRRRPRLRRILNFLQSRRRWQSGSLENTAKQSNRSQKTSPKETSARSGKKRCWNPRKRSKSSTSESSDSSESFLLSSESDF